jgi:hypothetical protein
VGSEARSFESQYPSVALWVNERGWIEISSDEFSTSCVRALDEGGLVWEGNDQYASLDDALRALDTAIAEWIGSG